MQFPPLRYALLVTAMCAGSVMANPIEQALNENTAHAQVASRSQQYIEQLDDATQKMLDEYRAALINAKNLEGYNKQMRALVAAQEQELQSYQQQLESLEATEAAVTPQMQRMLDVLLQFIAADLPFLPHERADRVESLKDLLPRADVSLAEKYRRILEAYQIESDYGRTMEVWRGDLNDAAVLATATQLIAVDETVDDGEEIEQSEVLIQETVEPAKTVDFLRLGRVMLYYQTPDGHESAWWNPRSKQWQLLDSNARRPLAQAIAVARQQKPVDWLELPVKTVKLEAQQ